MTKNTANTQARVQKIVIQTFEYICLLVVSFISLLPVVSSFLISFKTSADYGSSKAIDLPKVWSL